MNGNNIFIDTSIIFYLIAGDQTIAALLNGKKVFISFITELELLGYKSITDKDYIKILEILDKPL